ncbi:hypothetical protein ACJJTC_000839 [Scirpophaga incertulas]
MDLQLAFVDCEVAIRKFFKNDLAGARKIMSPWCRTSLYHSLGAAIFEFIPAILTFDHAQINRALSALKLCINLCNKQRKNLSLVESLGTIIRKSNYGNYTDVEAHAELCYAEALLLQAAMTIMEGEDLTGLIKGTIKVKSCYNSYRDCSKILVKKKWDCEESKTHFQSGVRLGIATFNLMISLLPPKIISLLEFVGFSGSKMQGLAELEAASAAPGMRSVLCDLTLLGYHLVICHFIGTFGDLELCEKILKKQLKIYPNSVWFLVFKGRLELLRGQLNTAMNIYHRVVLNQNTFQQFRHVCYWENMWIHALRTQWRDAAHYAAQLMEESSWSRTVYAYTKAVMLLQMDCYSEGDRGHCTDLLRSTEMYKQRIAGKSLPLEKFMIRRSERYFMQGSRLLLPAIELLCLWNMFHVFTNNNLSAHKILKMIEEGREVAEGCTPWRADTAADNRALARYLHGCCLNAMNAPRQALEILHSITLLKHEIQHDTFFIPYAIVEMAMCHYKLGEMEKALQYLHDARKKYSGYSLESRLHFRIHSKIQIVKEAMNAAESDK